MLRKWNRSIFQTEMIRDLTADDEPDFTQKRIVDYIKNNKRVREDTEGNKFEIIYKHNRKTAGV